jgi:hypothetical protein
MVTKTRSFRLDDETMDKLDYIQSSRQKEVSQQFSDKFEVSKAQVLTTLIEKEYRRLLIGEMGATFIQTAATVENKLPKYEITKKEKPKTQPRIGKVTQGIGKGTYLPWTVDNKVPCPLCNKWIALSTFNRHGNGQHKMPGQVIYADQGFREIADRMLAERKKETDKNL